MGKRERKKLLPKFISHLLLKKEEESKSAEHRIALYQGNSFGTRIRNNERLRASFSQWPVPADKPIQPELVLILAGKKSEADQVEESLGKKGVGRRLI